MVGLVQYLHARRHCTRSPHHWDLVLVEMCSHAGEDAECCPKRDPQGTVRPTTFQSSSSSAPPLAATQAWAARGLPKDCSNSEPTTDAERCAAANDIASLEKSAGSMQHRACSVQEIAQIRVGCGCGCDASQRSESTACQWTNGLNGKYTFMNIRL